jgi:hypothetical protein
MFEFCSVVIAPDGTIVDAFPTGDLRPVGSADGRILFVAGGGPTSWTGYFSPAPVVRDVANRSWHQGELPDGLPRYVAGAVGDVKWSVVCDLHEKLGYRISPRWLGDQCGGTFTCADNRYAYDSADFVVECATGRKALHAHDLDIELVSFARTAEGRWRFVGYPWAREDEPPPGLVLCTGDGEILRELPYSAAQMCPGGESLLVGTDDELVRLSATRGEAATRVDLRRLHSALGATISHDVGPLLALHGAPEDLAKQTPGSVRRALDRSYVSHEDWTEEAIATAIHAASTAPRLSELEVEIVRFH